MCYCSLFEEYCEKCFPQYFLEDRKCQEINSLNFYDKIYKIYDENLLVVDCSENRYYDQATEVCYDIQYDCHIGCLKCIGLEKFCLKCETDFILENSICEPFLKTQLSNDLLKILMKYLKLEMHGCTSFINLIEFINE